MTGQSSSSDAYFETFYHYDNDFNLTPSQQISLSKTDSTSSDLDEPNLSTDVKSTNSQSSPELIHYQDIQLLRPSLKVEKSAPFSHPNSSLPPPNTMEPVQSIPWSIDYTNHSSLPKDANDPSLKNPASLLYAIKTDFILCAMALNRDGSTLAYCDGRRVYFISLEDGQHMYSVELPPNNYELETRALAFSNDSKYLAVSICGGKIAVIYDRSVHCILSNHTSVVSALAFTDDYLISGGFDGLLSVWKISHNSESFTHMPNNASHATGQMSSSSSESSDSPHGNFKLYRKIQCSSIISIDVFPDKSLIAIGFLNSSFGIINGKLQNDFENNRDESLSTPSLSTSSNNNSGSTSMNSSDSSESSSSPESSDSPRTDYTASSTSSDQGSNGKNSDQPSPQQMATTNDQIESTSISTTSSNQLSENSTEEVNHSKILRFEAHTKSLLGVAVSSKDYTIITCSQDKTAKLWDISHLSPSNITSFESSDVITSPPTLLATFEGHQDFVTVAAFSPINNTIFTGSKDETIKAWNREGVHLFTLNAHKNTLFSIKHHPTKPIFAACSGDGLLCVWKYTPL